MIDGDISNNEDEENASEEISEDENASELSTNEGEEEVSADESGEAEKEKDERTILERRLDRLAWVLEGGSMCAAVSVINGEFYISANDFFDGTGKRNDPRHLIQVTKVMRYFQEVATSSGEEFSEEARSAERSALIVSLCKSQFSGQTKGAVRIPSKILNAIVRKDVLSKYSLDVKTKDSSLDPSLDFSRDGTLTAFDYARALYRTFLKLERSIERKNEANAFTEEQLNAFKNFSHSKTGGKQNGLRYKSNILFLPKDNSKAVHAEMQILDRIIKMIDDEIEARVKKKVDDIKEQIEESRSESSNSKAKNGNRKRDSEKKEEVEIDRKPLYKEAYIELKEAIINKEIYIPQEIYIGISKKCCLNCRVVLETAQEKLQTLGISIKFGGAHDAKFEGKWGEPPFFEIKSKSDGVRTKRQRQEDADLRIPSFAQQIRDQYRANIRNAEGKLEQRKEKRGENEANEDEKGYNMRRAQSASEPSENEESELEASVDYEGLLLKDLEVFVRWNGDESLEAQLLQAVVNLFKFKRSTIKEIFKLQEFEDKKIKQNLKLDLEDLQIAKEADEILSFIKYWLAGMKLLTVNKNSTALTQDDLDEEDDDKDSDEGDDYGGSFGEEYDGDDDLTDNEDPADDGDPADDEYLTDDGDLTNDEDEEQDKSYDRDQQRSGSEIDEGDFNIDQAESYDERHQYEGSGEEDNYGEDRDTKKRQRERKQPLDLSGTQKPSNSGEMLNSYQKKEPDEPKIKRKKKARFGK